MKGKELYEGKRIAVLEKIGCRLFKTSNFSEVLCFSMRYKGVQAKEVLEGLVKLQFEDKMMKAPVKMSANGEVEVLFWRNLVTVVQIERSFEENYQN